MTDVCEIGRRTRNQPAPPHVIFEALTFADRPGARVWLELLEDEQPPTVVRSQAHSAVVWSSIWLKRPDAVVEFVLASDGESGTNLGWTLFTADPAPDDALIGHLRKRMNQLVNADLRHSFGQ